MKVAEPFELSPSGHRTLLEIAHTGNPNRPNARERARLAETYTKGEVVEDRGDKVIHALFGVTGMPLPQEYVATVQTMVEEYDPSDEEEEVITQVEQPVRTRLGRPRKAEAE